MRKVAIIAKTATAVFAPYDDPTWELWGLPWVRYRRTLDLYFDVHSDKCWQVVPMPVDEQRDWERFIETTGAPILCHPSRVYLFRNARPFPFDAVADAVPVAFFENTIAYQLGYALWSHRQAPIGEVGIFGANMMGTREYLWERASVLYMVGLLQGAGIKVTVPPGSALFMSYWMAGRYGETAEKRFAI